MTAKYTRIDLHEYPDCVSVAKWTGEPTPGVPYRANERSQNTEMSYDDMVAWMKSHGWDVIEFADLRDGRRCARGWAGERFPIRTRGEILKMRNQMFNGKLKAAGQFEDLAYWY